MAASDEQVLRLRRMVAEPGTTTYSDSSLAAYIEAHPLIDDDGYEPEDDDWTDTYDLAAAAGDVWEEKAAALVGGYDFAADGGDFKRSQAVEQAERQARHWRSRRTPTSARMHVDKDYAPDYQALDESTISLSSYVVNDPETGD